MNRAAPVLYATLVVLSMVFLAGSVPLAALELAEAPVRLDPPGQPSALRPTAATDGGHRFAVAWRTVGPAGQEIGAAMIDAATGVITHPDVPDPEPGPATEVSRPAVVVLPGDEFVALIGWGELQTDLGCALARPVDVLGPILGESQLACFPATAPPQVALAALPGVGFAAVWTQPVRSATGPTAVFLRLFDLGGRFLSEPVRVWRFSPGSQIAPQVLRDAEGRLLVAWQQPWPDGVPRLLARRFGPDAAPLGPAFQLETGLTFAGRPRLAGAPEGRFVAAWEDVIGEERNLVAAQFAPGSPVAAVSHELSGFPSPEVGRPDVAMDSHGNVAVAWEGRAPSAERDEVMVTRIGAAGQRQLTHAFDGPTGGHLGSPAVALADSGLLLVAFESEQPGEETEIEARLIRVGGDDDLCLYRGDVFLCSGDRQIRFGNGILAGDHPFLADVDGDGSDDPCVRRGATFLCDTAHDGGEAELALPFGTAAQTPLLGDVDGDGREDPCVRRGRSWLCDTAHNGGAAEFRLRFGPGGIAPFLGDVDGDGDDDPCLFLATSQALSCDANHDGVQDLSLDLASLLPGGQIVLGDPDGDGRDDPCVQRGSELWCDTSRTGIPVQYSFDSILAGDVVLLGDVDNF